VVSEMNIEQGLTILDFRRKFLNIEQGLTILDFRRKLKAGIENNDHKS